MKWSEYSRDVIGWILQSMSYGPKEDSGWCLDSHRLWRVSSALAGLSDYLDELCSAGSPSLQSKCGFRTRSRTEGSVHGPVASSGECSSTFWHLSLVSELSTCSPPSYYNVSTSHPTPKFISQLFIYFIFFIFHWIQLVLAIITHEWDHLLEHG